jgi:hypothetical protein
MKACRSVAANHRRYCHACAVKATGVPVPFGPRAYLSQMATILRMALTAD